MTDNMKEFLEAVSNESDEYKENLSKALKSDVIAAAAQKGITLTDEDFVRDEKLSPDELEAVAGGGGLDCFFVGAGGSCGCFLGGGGEGCGCAIGGIG